MIRITGASDDLIEIDGAINEEFSSYDCKDGLLAVSDGTLIKVEYDDNGIWRLTPLYRGSSYVGHSMGDIEQDTNDVVSMDGVIKWIVFMDEPQSALVK